MMVVVLVVVVVPSVLDGEPRGCVAQSWGVLVLLACHL